MNETRNYALERDSPLYLDVISKLKGD